ncbi:UDP-N-acetylmuramoyl-L-alanine--D-glutamate ligase [Candidatus Parcubacteria bacterium]|nr:MAG: UDP-N-acetylmuramoyl-L-alanine--D-glutamate ligase [Candidatus Parcubacteria bacterium]
MDLSKIENFQDAIVTVMGLGRYQQGSGMGAAKWLIRHGAQTIITDLKSEEELEESMDLIMGWYEKYREMYPDRTIYAPVFVLGEHRQEDFVDVDCVVQNPGVPSESDFVLAAKKAGVSIESDVSLFWRFCPYPIIAVTGTKGKTTTTKMIGEMLTKVDDKAIIAGNIKVSPLEFLDELLHEKQERPIVLELSSWMLESLPPAFKDLGKGPDVAVLTNVFPDHLNRYHSFGDYVHSKEIIFEWQSSDQYTVLNWDHETVRLMGERAKGKVFWCSKSYQDANGCYVKDGEIVFQQDGKIEKVIDLQDVALQGEHNLENVLTSIAAARLRGIDWEIIRQVVKEFKGVSDRQELVREVDEISYINDTTATNPDAVMAALNRFGADKDIILIAGGMDKALKYDELGDAIANTCKHVVLFEGDASDMIEKAIDGRVPVTKGIKTMKDAVQTAKSLAASGDIVLLSPGAASFNLFKNEFDRGEQFREEVRNL